MEVMDVDRGQKKGHFSHVKLTSVILTFKNHLLTQVKLGSATYGSVVVVGFACMACNIFFDFTSESS